VADELLEPTRIYVKPVLELLSQASVHAMAHVTGGGITGNLPRVLPDGCRARIRRGSWPVPAVFTALAEAGGVAEAEMFRTFNMGIGYVLVTAPGDLGLKALADLGVFRIGDIVAGERGVELIA
jgi:phosphoribosylformylglycinamidine cyclo-ligase